MPKPKPPYSLNASTPRPRLLLTAVVCFTLLAYFNFAWFAQPAPLVPVVAPGFVSSSTAVKSKIPRILLVSALFPLEHAKHSHDDYTSWLQNFLGPDGVQCDIFFYTTPVLEPLIRSLGSSTHTSYNLTINATYRTPFAVPPLADYKDKYARMHAWDRERAIHSPELYAVWNSKPWLLEHALVGHDDTYDYAFWVDAGSFRAAHPFRTWPDPARVEEVFSNRKEGESKDRVLFPLYKLPGRREFPWRVEKGPLDMDFSEGSFFGSTPSGIEWFSKTFYEAHDRYINTTPTSRHPHAANHNHHGVETDTASSPSFHFVGKDQTLINTLLLRDPSRFLGILSPSRTSLLPPTHDAATDDHPRIPYVLTFASAVARTRAVISHIFGPATACGDWYYYQWWLATPGDRERAREMGWLRCGKTGTAVIRIDELLRGLFGARWVEGRRAGGG
ncbi:hypothetical protein DXG01_003276 [Tephrocybe rancida]|nr:hypothetical protein DXG01_003276 [Tephrocybe rancida]